MNENDWIFDKRLWAVILMVAAAVLAEMWWANQSFTAAFCNLFLFEGGVVLLYLAWRIFWGGIRQSKR
jgi:hypothetical protein